MLYLVRARTVWRLALMPDQRPVHSWVFPRAVVATTFVLVSLQSDHSRSHDSLTPSGCTLGGLSRAMVHAVFTARRPFGKSKFNLKYNRVNHVAPASPIKCLLYLLNVRTIQFKLGPERLTRLGNLNVLRLPVTVPYSLRLWYKYLHD